MAEASKEKGAETHEIREQFQELKKDVVELGRQIKTEVAAKLGDAQKKVVDTQRRVIGQSREWVKEHPAASVGIIAGVAACIGFILGLLVGRRSRD
jgi:ElaB/YqjD/DUF883 family membrane-anchored ribosome-binding protein